VPVLNADTFAIDNFRAAHQAVASLIKREHRRIALVSNAPHRKQQYLISSVRERIDGYRAALTTPESRLSKISLSSEAGTARISLASSQALLFCKPSTAFLATDSSVALVLLTFFGKWIYQYRKRFRSSV